MFNLIESTLTLTARFWKMNFDLRPRYICKGLEYLIVVCISIDNI